MRRRNGNERNSHLEWFIFSFQNWSYFTSSMTIDFNFHVSQFQNQPIVRYSKSNSYFNLFVSAVHRRRATCVRVALTNRCSITVPLLRHTWSILVWISIFFFFFFFTNYAFCPFINESKNCREMRFFVNIYLRSRGKIQNKISLFIFSQKKFIYFSIINLTV